MNQLEIELSEGGKGGRRVNVPYEVSDSVKDFAERIRQSVEVDGIAVLEVVLGGSVDETTALRDLKLQTRVEIHRVCVDVHFETESEMRWFPVQAKWATVHRWACKQFDVARDACANLELREGSITGTAINERQAIGAAKECKLVWLVKPGPEANG